MSNAIQQANTQQQGQSDAIMQNAAARGTANSNLTAAMQAEYDALLPPEVSADIAPTPVGEIRAFVPDRPQSYRVGMNPLGRGAYNTRVFGNRNALPNDAFGENDEQYLTGEKVRQNDESKPKYAELVSALNRNTEATERNSKNSSVLTTTRARTTRMNGTPDS